MKRILWAGAFALVAGGQALAADLPPPVAPRAPATYVPTTVPYYNWSGIYIGVNGGYAFGNSTWTDSVAAAAGGAGTTGSFPTRGGLAGGTVGGNVQWGAVVLGIEGDWDWSNLNGTSGVPANCVPGGCETKADWLATVRGRAGWAIDRVLLYGTGGAAFAPVQAGFPVAGTGFSSNTQVGWTAGAGIEFAFAPNWTAKAEYLYVDLGNSNCTTTCFVNGATGFSDATSVKFTENIIRAGVNFKFNPW
jgi:outer membrane immunogenic protein